MATRTVPKNAKQPVVEMLAHTLALSGDLYSQVKQAHWTVVGPGFIAVHRLFDEQAAMLSLHVDQYAERIRQLEMIPRGTVRETAKASDLPEIEARELMWDEAVGFILERFEQYADALHEAIEDAEKLEDRATQDIFIEALRGVDLQSYFLRSYLAADARR